jgi:hypothetical protein
MRIWGGILVSVHTFAGHRVVHVLIARSFGRDLGWCEEKVGPKEYPSGLAFKI